jgi:hypothetical protein
MPGSQFFRGLKPVLFRRSFRAAPALPKLVSECGDIALFDLVSDHFGGVLDPGRLMLLLCVQVSLIGVLKGLSGAFVTRQVISFSVALGAAAMGVGGKVTVLGRYLL